jgi:hypothetical protein
MSVQKEAVSVREMAEMVGLSRARFYQLLGDTFPPPIHDVATGRPFYPRELQQICLDVRFRNRGVNGQPAVFYAKRAKTPQSKARKTAANNRYDDLVEGLRAMDLVEVTPEQVATAMERLYPHGVKDVDGSEVLKNLFLAIHGSSSG